MAEQIFLPFGNAELTVFPPLGSSGSNELGLTLEEVNALPAAELTIRKQDVRRRMLAAGAHYVIDSVEELPAVIDDINNFKIPRI